MKYINSVKIFKLQAKFIKIKTHFSHSTNVQHLIELLPTQIRSFCLNFEKLLESSDSPDIIEKSKLSEKL